MRILDFLKKSIYMNFNEQSYNIRLIYTQQINPCNKVHHVKMFKAGVFLYFGDKLSHYIIVIGSLSLWWRSSLLVLLVLSSLHFGSAHDLLPACHIVTHMMPECEKGQHLIPRTDLFSSDHWGIVLRSIPLFSRTALKQIKADSPRPAHTLPERSHTTY